MSDPVTGPVLVTGCSSGIGSAVAERLARSGHRVWATARRPAELSGLAAAGCRVLGLDVVDEDSRAAAVRTVEEADGPLGALVNNAGYGVYGPLEEVDLDRVRTQFETNVFGLLRLCQLVLPGMRGAGRGRIVNIGSMGGRLTLPGGGAYHASKYAVEALSDALRFEVRPFGVDVSLVEPGPIATRFIDTAHAETPGAAGGPYAAFNEAVERRNRAAYEGPGARLGGSPQDVAAVVEKALTARRPRARYPVTATARVMISGRRVAPDRVWDALLRTQFRVPSG